MRSRVAALVNVDAETAALINHWAPWEQRMRRRRAAVHLQWTEAGINRCVGTAQQIVPDAVGEAGTPLSLADQVEAQRENGAEEIWTGAVRTRCGQSVSRAKRGEVVIPDENIAGAAGSAGADNVKGHKVVARMKRGICRAENATTAAAVSSSASRTHRLLTGCGDINRPVSSTSGSAAPGRVAADRARYRIKCPGSIDSRPAAASASGGSTFGSISSIAAPAGPIAADRAIRQGQAAQGINAATVSAVSRPGPESRDRILPCRRARSTLPLTVHPVSTRVPVL